MSAEIKITIPAIAYLKNVITINVTPPSPLSIDVAGENSMHDVLPLTTADSNLSKGNITTLGLVYLKNLDPTNNILIGTDGTTYPMMLKPGEFAYWPCNTAAVHAKAAAGTPLLEYSFIEA